MKYLKLLVLFMLIGFGVNAQEHTFEIRGVLPWHNFLSGPSAWNESDYRSYLDECSEKGINFIGFHNYTGGGERYATYVEPMIRISYNNIVPEAYFDHSGSARWGYLPMKVEDFAFGTASKFSQPKGAEYFGSDCSVLSKTKEEHYKSSQDLMKNVLRMCKERNMKMAMGFEFGVLPPEYFSLNGFYWYGEANMVPDPTHEIAIGIHYAAIDNILETYQGLDYIWLWLNEHCFMGVDASKIKDKGTFGKYYNEKQALFSDAKEENLKFVGVWSLKYIELTMEYLKKKAPHVKLILGGWGGSNQLPLLMKGLDKALPSNITFSCLNPGLGSQAQPDFLGEIASNRKVWAIPWLEGDHQLWHHQPRVGLLKSHLQLAAEQKLNGVVAIHWRTEDVKFNMNTFSHFALHPNAKESMEQLYTRYLTNEFGKDAAKRLVDDMVRWETESLNDGVESPEFYRYTVDWGILNAKNLAFRESLVKKIETVKASGREKENLERFKKGVEFEILLHQVSSAMKPAYELRKEYLESGTIPSENKKTDVQKRLLSAPLELMLKTYAEKAVSKGELGVLSAINQKLVQTYNELQLFIESL